MPEIQSTGITVIIPTYNRSTILEKCLEALDCQIISNNTYEVIVVDDGSTDETKTVVQRFEKSDPDIFRYYFQPNRGANAARNLAIEKAKGRLLLFINDDTIATPRMLEQHVKSHAIYKEETIAVLGKVTISPDLPYSIFSHVHLDCMYKLWEDKSELDWRAFYTCNISVYRSFLKKYGLFDASMRYHEDVELAERLSHCGLKILYNDHALGYHLHYLTEHDYLSTAIREGKALTIWYQKAPHLREELASIDFYLTMPMKKRWRYWIADIIINQWTIPVLRIVARFLQSKHEKASLFVYKKIYQALKRKTIREKLTLIIHE